MIPLSLYVSLEIIKAFQLLLMSDIEMFDEPSNTPMEARTSTINEDLGQIRYMKACNRHCLRRLMYLLATYSPTRLAHSLII